MNNLLKNFLGFSLGPVISAGILFLIMIITTHYLPPDEYGRVSMFVVIQTLLTGFIYIGIDQSYVREFHNYRDRKFLFQNALLIPLIVCIFFSCVIFIFQKQLSNLLFGSDEYYLIANLLSIVLIFVVIERFILLYIRMQERAYEYSFFYIALKVIIFIFTVLFLILYQKNFETIIYATVLGQVVGDLFLILRYFKLFKLKKNYIDLKLIKEMLKFGFPIIVAISLSNFLNVAGALFLRNFNTYEDLGIYTAALKLASILQVIQLAFASFWVPVAYRWYKENKNIESYNLMSNLLMLVLTFLFFFLIFVKKYIVLILSSDYIEAQYLIGFLCLPPILYTLSETTCLGISFSKKSYYNIYVSVLSLIPCLLVNYYLTPSFGAIGASLAVSISYVVFYFSRSAFSQKCGFHIKIKVQSVIILLFLLTAFINIKDNSYTLWGNIICFLFALVIQYRTFFNLKNNVNILV